jgi:hypothetical protein
VLAKWPRVVPEPAEWESMAHSLTQGILGRAKGISLRFSPGASRPRSSVVAMPFISGIPSLWR